MTEFTVVVLRFAFFIALWLFVFFVASVLSRDIFGPRRSRAQRRAAKRARQSTSPASANGSGHNYTAGTAQTTAPVIHELAVTAGPLTGYVMALGTAPVTLGRSQDNTLVLDDDFASGHHARIAPTRNGEWYVEDLGSTNGTFIGNERLSGATLLGARTPVTIGNTVVELRS